MEAELLEQPFSSDDGVKFLKAPLMCLYYVQQQSYSAFKATKICGKFCMPLKMILGRLSCNGVEEKLVLQDLK